MMKKTTLAAILVIPVAAAAAAVAVSLAPLEARSHQSNGSVESGTTVADLAADAERDPAVTFAVAGTGNAARYRVREQLVGFDLPNDAVGTTSDVSGAIGFDASGKVIPATSRIVVNVATLQSDKDRRDGYVRGRILETEQFPRVELAITYVRGLELPVPSSGTRALTLGGNLTIRGVTRPTTWQLNATFTDSTVTGTASTAFTFDDFTLTQPRVPVVLSVADTIRLEYDFTFVRTSALDDERPR
jgi:polyisoprenoid-binding protein YceI